MYTTNENTFRNFFLKKACEEKLKVKAKKGHI